MALLNALAARRVSSFSDLITGCSSCIQDTKAVYDDITVRRSAGIPICALVDSNGSPNEVAHVVSQLVEEGFTTVKIKVRGHTQSNYNEPINSSDINKLFELIWQRRTL